MKPPFLLFLLFTVFACSDVTGQTRAAVNFDLRDDSVENALRNGTERQRVAQKTNAPSPAAAELEQQIFSMINAERRKNGLSDLEWSDSVAAVARLHSQDMARAKFFGHRGSDGSMVDERADRVGLGTWRSIGENIAYMRGYDNPAEVAVEKWLESSPHRKNLLTPTWKESAVGVAIAPDGTYYMTEVFLLRN
jgi:uncharacterized protein YkwD